MTLDYTLLYHPTDSLILPTKRRFFPFKIPVFHHQLRHYISTADPDRIYVVVDRVIHSIHISSRKWDTIARIPFEPRCFAAGYGWIAVGAPDNGECAFVRLSDQTPPAPHADSSSHEADVDAALPIDLDSSTRAPPAGTSTEETRSSSTPCLRQPAQVEIKKFGGSIVNSVTIHRLPGDGERLAHEDVVLISNNDKTVKIYSLTRSKILEVIHHPAAMNYAIISPDSTVLAAVGDENFVYFYRITRDESAAVEHGDRGARLTGWKWKLLRCLELQLSTGFDDGSCFTVAFSPSSHLCAVGSQSGIITIFDVETIRRSRNQRQNQDPKLCMFRSSRPDSDAGAVRSMAFSPDPWDLLVWVEDTGRAGIADVRQAYSRRQILNLDANDPELQKVQTSPSALSGGARSELEDLAASSGDDMSTIQQTLLDLLDRSSSAGQNAGASDQLRESLVQDLTDRERQIIEFLNTARWTSRQDEGTDDGLPRTTIHLRPGSNPLGSAEVPNRSSRTTSPYRSNDALHELFRENYLGRASANPRRQGAIVLAQANPGPSGQSSETSNSATADVHLLLRWTTSPLDMQSSENPLRANGPGTAAENDIDAGEVGTDNQLALSRASALIDTSFPSPEVTSSETRQRSQRSRSIPRRSLRPIGTAESRYEARATNSELRANVAAERLRRQRLAANEIRSPRWIRNILNDLPDRNLGHLHRDQDPGGMVGAGVTAGVGWGADGRTLYIATVEGIFEFQLNIQDRKTFPVLSYR
ncbi:hypothetical protein VTN77DRAFT_3546 [Rasamsonia byssochlamydoides]|uniref:uncharacterized protein n=1 Tax=Rasamsonia byssochlamydoides TaxID=89139 RepID=UPI0037448D78